MRFRSYFGFILTVLALTAPAGTAFAASQAYCDRLKTELTALDASMAGNSASETLAALKKAERERDRTIAYSKSIGCNDMRIPILSGPAPSQCPTLKAQVKQLESTIAGLREEAGRAADNEDLARRKADITAAYQQGCTAANAPQSAGGFAPPANIPGAPPVAGSSGVASSGAVPPPAAPATKAAPKTKADAQKPLLAKIVPKGLFESLFGVSTDNASESEMPDSGSADAGIDAAGGTRTICVRTCDGYFFPISPYASRTRLQLDQDLCHASCPSAETRLYVQGLEADVDTATAADDGSPYTALPNAFKYRTALDQTCTCRAAGKTWADTLIDAERILGVNGQTDAQISELKAQELSRPRDIKAAQTKGKKTDPKTPLPPTPPITDATIASIAPTAIPVGTTVVPASEGEFREITAPDGTKKKIRILRAPGAAAVTSTEQN